MEEIKVKDGTMIEEIYHDIENRKSYYEQYSKSQVTWEVLEIDMKVNKAK